MKICVFGYNFEHKKTYEGLCKLNINNIKISKIFAANKVFLNSFSIIFTIFCIILLINALNFFDGIKALITIIKYRFTN